MAEDKLLCPLSFIFNMASLVPGALEKSTFVFSYCAGMQCKWWVEREGRKGNCAIVILSERMERSLQ
jgi:hypothetical protein